MYQDDNAFLVPFGGSIRVSDTDIVECSSIKGTIHGVWLG